MFNTILRTTISSSSAVASTSMIEKDVTKLWHMRLKHMRKKGMNVLSKRDLLCGQSTSKIEICEHYILGKHKRFGFQMTIHKTKMYS